MVPFLLRKVRDSNPRIILLMYGLANRCITTLPTFLKTPILPNRHHPNHRRCQGRPL